MNKKKDIDFMQIALQLAQQAAAEDEVPVGAIVVLNDVVIAHGYNQTRSQNDPTAHAEIVAIRAAAHTLRVNRLPATTLYVTLEPCAMCAGALVNARVGRLVYGAREPRSGAVVSAFELLMSDLHNHRVSITEGVLESQCAQQMLAFFAARR